MEMYRDLSQYFGGNTTAVYKMMLQARDYEIAKSLLSQGVSERIVATTMELTPPELTILKREAGLM